MKLEDEDAFFETKSTACYQEKDWCPCKKKKKQKQSCSTKVITQEGRWFEAKGIGGKLAPNYVLTITLLHEIRRIFSEVGKTCTKIRAT